MSSSLSSLPTELLFHIAKDATGASTTTTPLEATKALVGFRSLNRRFRAAFQDYGQLFRAGVYFPILSIKDHGPSCDDSLFESDNVSRYGYWRVYTDRWKEMESGVPPSKCGYAEWLLKVHSGSRPLVVSCGMSLCTAVIDLIRTGKLSIGRLDPGDAYCSIADPPHWSPGLSLAETIREVHLRRGNCKQLQLLHKNLPQLRVVEIDEHICYCVHQTEEFRHIYFDAHIPTDMSWLPQDHLQVYITNLSFNMFYLHGYNPPNIVDAVSKITPLFASGTCVKIQNIDRIADVNCFTDDEDARSSIETFDKLGLLKLITFANFRLSRAFLSDDNQLGLVAKTRIYWLYGDDDVLQDLDTRLGELGLWWYVSAANDIEEAHLHYNNIVRGGSK